MSNKYLEKIASSDISRDALFKGVKHLNTDYYDGQRAGVGDSARTAGWSALYGAGLGGGGVAALGSVIPASHLIRGNTALAKLSLGGVGRKSLIGAGIGAAGLGATSLLRRYGSMKRTEDFDSKANALGISPEDRKHYVEEYNAFNDDLPASETAQRVHALMHSKQASDYEYSGPSNWQTAGLTAAGLGGSSALLGSAVNDVITPEIRHGLANQNMLPLMLRMRELTESAKNGMGGVKSNPLAYKVARKGAGAVALGGLALSLPVGVAAHRQYQDFQSGNPDSHYLRSALLGGVAGGLAPTKHLTVGRGALAGLGASAANQIYQHYKG